MNATTHARSARSRLLQLIGPTFLAGALATAGGAFGQDAEQLKAGVTAWKAGGCSGCHGTFAEGGAGGAMPAGPSLRASSLDHDQLVEVISCGRPGTVMPYNLAGAYTETPCYGLPLGAPPEGATGGASLSGEQVAALADYLTAVVVGQGDVTLEQCALLYGRPESPFCDAFR